MKQTVKFRWHLALCFISAVIAIHGFTQISDYEECSDGLDLDSYSENLTAEERIALMDQDFETELFDVERCETSDSGGGGGGGNSGGASAGADIDSGGSEAQASASAAGLLASPNALEEGERSIAVTSDMRPNPIDLDTEESSMEPGKTGTNGKEHERLAPADNKKALAEGILKRAEGESDPVVKAALMKRYEELTR